MSGDGSVQRQDNASAARRTARIRRARALPNTARSGRSVEARKTRIAAQRCEQWMHEQKRDADVVMRTDGALEGRESDVACAENGGPGSALGRCKIPGGVEGGERRWPGRRVIERG